MNLSDEAVNAAAKALHDSWNAMHTNEAMGRQRMMARRALWAAMPYLVEEIIYLVEDHSREEYDYDSCHACGWNELSGVTYEEHITDVIRGVERPWNS